MCANMCICGTGVSCNEWRCCWSRAEIQFGALALSNLRMEVTNDLKPTLHCCFCFRCAPLTVVSACICTAAHKQAHASRPAILGGEMQWRVTEVPHEVDPWSLGRGIGKRDTGAPAIIAENYSI